MWSKRRTPPSQPIHPWPINRRHRAAAGHAGTALRAAILAALIGAGAAVAPADPAMAAENAAATRRLPPRAAHTPAAAARPAQRRDAPLPPLCDTAGEMRTHRAGFNLAEVEAPDALAVPQNAMQICVSAVPLPGRPAPSGPVWRG